MKYIYKITNPKGMVYIGQTINPIKRKHQYKYLNCKKQHMLYNSLLKYGWNTHIFEVLTVVSLEYADDAEIAYIDYYKSYYTTGGMNLTKGGSSREITSEMKKHLSDGIMGAKNVKAKQLYQYTMNAEFVKLWDCMKCMQRELGFPTTAISSAIKRGSYYAYGFLWSYEDIDFRRVIPNKRQVSRRKPL